MTVDIDAIIGELNNAYPCRKVQFLALSSFIGHPSFPRPPAICLTGFPATGKCTVTRAFLEATETEFAWVDCSETFSTASLFDRIINRLREIGDMKIPRLKMSGDINNFVVEVQNALMSLKGKVILVRPFRGLY